MNDAPVLDDKSLRARAWFDALRDRIAAEFARTVVSALLEAF